MGILALYGSNVDDIGSILEANTVTMVFSLQLENEILCQSIQGINCYWYKLLLVLCDGYIDFVWFQCG